MTKGKAIRGAGPAVETSDEGGSRTGPCYLARCHRRALVLVRGFSLLRRSSHGTDTASKQQNPIWVPRSNEPHFDARVTLVPEGMRPPSGKTSIMNAARVRTSRLSIRHLTS